MFAIIDIETTGGNCSQGKITEIAIFIHDGKQVINEFSTLVNPQMPIPPFVQRLTGITDQMVSTAPKFYEVAKEIVLITQNTTIIAHNSKFDYSFIKEEFKNLGYSFVREHLCTVKLSRKYIPFRASYSLGKLCKDLGIQVANRHRAKGDAEATVKLFEMILQENPEEIKIAI